ncbi:GNAT family N-acetyltransferase [Streptomyces sp. NPDC089919]|uniref:GNAT family N-acetyltransferase n=1 Tax=Streptomyces sp. NPDC089919 TaxID=3155188 RepID=UPI00342C6377
MNTFTITRPADTCWEAVADDLVVGQGDLSHRTDGRRFISIDVWQDAAFEPLAAAMLAELPAPLHTLVREDDHALALRWERAGFTPGRREGEYTVPTDPAATGLDAVPPPPGVAFLPGAEADPDLLRELDRAVRAEVDAAAGWQTMPAEVVPLPVGDTLGDPAKYTVAVHDGRYAGLVRVVPVRSRARIGLIAVRADQRRLGIGRALLGHALGALHRAGTGSAWAEVDAANGPAAALFEGCGARRTGGYLELVRP